MTEMERGEKHSSRSKPFRRLSAHRKEGIDFRIMAILIPMLWLNAY